MNTHEQLPALNPSHKRRRLIVGCFSTKKPGVGVPYLRVFGRWMQEAGFVIGRHVKIDVSEGRLTIEQVD
jgi:hypothetical protein